MEAKTLPLKTACIVFTVGCHRSMVDAALFVDYFKESGWNITDRIREADVILLGTCGVTSELELLSLKYLTKINKRKKKDAEVIVFGCLTGLNKAKIIEGYGALPVTKNDVAQIEAIANSSLSIASFKNPPNLSDYKAYFENIFGWYDKLNIRSNLFSYNYFFKVYSKMLQCLYNRPSLSLRSSTKLFTLKIASGCMGHCTYCAIKYGVGALRSRPLSAVIEDFRSGLAKGYQIFRLTAEDVGSYGQDLGLNIVDLLWEITATPGDFTLQLEDFSPRWLVQYFPELLEIFKGQRGRIGYICLPTQSGSEEVLKLMGRDYSAADAKHCLLALKKAIPELDMRTHILLGFPGETEADFAATLDMLQQVQFNLVTIYNYSERSGTEAMEFPHKVAGREKLSRVWRTIRTLPRGKALSTL